MGWQTNPSLAAITGPLDSLNPASTEDADRVWRNFFRSLKKGKDVSGITAFQPMIQAGEAQQRMAHEAGSYGDAGMMAANGTPEQQAVLARQGEIAGERAKEGTGEAILGEVPGLIQSGTGYGLEEAANANEFALNKFRTKAGAINANSQYVQSPWWGIAQGLVGGAAKAATSFI